MWEKNAVHNPQVTFVPGTTLFECEGEDYNLPILEESRYEQAFDEIELLGFPLCSPFDLIDGNVGYDVLTRDLTACIGKTVKMLGYYVTRKPVTTSKGTLMNFGTWLDQEGSYFDTTHFPPSLARYPFKGKGCYLITGTVVEDFGFPSLEVSSMVKLPYIKDERY